MGKKPLSSSPNVKAFADVHASLAKIEELEKQVAKLSELAYFRNGGRTWKEVATVALHDHEQATAELSALREELDRATKGQWTKAESDAVKWRAQERLGQLGLAYCSWCDYSQQYVVGSDEQTQAHAALRAHAKMCKNNPNNHVDADPASLFMQAVARAEKAEQALDALGRVMFKQYEAISAQVQALQQELVTAKADAQLARSAYQKFQGYTDWKELRGKVEAAAAEIAQLTAQQLEVCICAALQLPDGELFRGHRHDDAIHTAGKAGVAREAIYAAEQGFITSRNRFVTRDEGAALQRAAGIPSAQTGTLPDGMLFSEDLYLRSTKGQMLAALTSAPEGTRP
jgi:hypothetical protein